MRTNIDIDDELLEEAKRLSGITTKKELVHEALRTLIQQKKKTSLANIRGKISFAKDYNYKKMRGRSEK